MLRSIRWKFITIYFLLVFIAMVIVGIFMTSQFEHYYLNKVRDDLKYISNNTVKKFLPQENLGQNRDNIQKDIERIPLSIGYQVIIVDASADFEILASSNPEIARMNALELLDDSVMLAASVGKISEKNVGFGDNGKYAVKHMAFPYKDKNGRVIGIIYCMANLDDIYKILDNSKVIFIRAIELGLLVTIILGFLVGTSITTPINDVTKKALKMAKGDFDQVVEVKSDDEIGQLGRMFNYLTAKLKQTLSEISSEKSKLDAIITHMADGLLAVDFMGGIVHLNPRFLEMMSLEGKAVDSMDYEGIIGRYSKNLMLESILECGSDFGSEVVEVESGAILKVSFACIRDASREVSLIILVLQDITEHQKLDNMRREFVANVSHELRTPITTIKSYSETLLSGAVDDKATTMQFLKVIESETDRMALIVRELLQLSQLDTKNVDWKFEQVELVAFTSAIAKKFSLAFSEKNHNFIHMFPEEPVLIKADTNKLEQALQNILTNCIKYTPDGGDISLAVSSDDERAYIRIRDNGIGIPKEAMSRIFERFYRVDKARSRDMGGTGLGLSITKHIIEDHGGSISVESELGSGTIFILSLPLDKPV